MFYTPSTTDHLIDNSADRPKVAVVELKGHPFPQLAYPNSRPNKRHIHNVLLAEAKKDFRLNGGFQENSDPK
jgi:hypothetical protein